MSETVLLEKIRQLPNTYKEDLFSYLFRGA